MPEPGEVKAARNRAGMTQQQLADLLGVHVKTLRDYEKGKRARLRAGQAKLSDFIAAHPEPIKVVPQPLIEQRALAEATDMELIAALTARLAELRRALDTAQVLPIPDPPAPVAAQDATAPSPQGLPEPDPSASSAEEPPASEPAASEEKDDAT
jgi:transcriptional regulator with XRE-family HTH domain